MDEGGRVMMNSARMMMILRMRIEEEGEHKGHIGCLSESVVRSLDASWDVLGVYWRSRVTIVASWVLRGALGVGGWVASPWDPLGGPIGGLLGQYCGLAGIRRRIGSLL